MLLRDENAARLAQRPPELGRLCARRDETMQLRRGKGYRLHYEKALLRGMKVPVMVGICATKGCGKSTLWKFNSSCLVGNGCCRKVRTSVLTGNFVG